MPFLPFQIKYIFVIFSVISIHEKLSNLTQIAEISLPATPEGTPDGKISEIKKMQGKPIDSELQVSYDMMKNYIAAVGWTSLYVHHS